MKEIIDDLRKVKEVVVSIKNDSKTPGTEKRKLIMKEIEVISEIKKSLDDRNKQKTFFKRGVPRILNEEEIKAGFRLRDPWGSVLGVAIKQIEDYIELLGKVEISVS